MPWDTNDYPSSLKNLETPIRKKAIEIGNAMLDDGHKEEDAIPIATEQAKEWYTNASKEEVNAMKYASDEDLIERDEEDRGESNPDLMDNAVQVKKHEDGWAVWTKGAQQPSEVKGYKKEALDRAKEIADNRNTEVHLYKEDGSFQEKISF
ncbi:DUF2188 domain-containing protein [Halalkalibacillus halophilus]|uniref:DUF2188 domain-containing protein n=1 Tax=Halalkalibacillus halophilus TaxID=392827 RepID=UPI0004133A10|nr:DUF2188 domain-containing protein [Halalkalibacillus halophilus]